MRSLSLTPTIPRVTSRSFTLAELVVVLLIIAATAGIAGLLVTGTSNRAQEDTVRVSFLRIQAAIYGGEGRPGYFHDLGRPPRRLVDLLRHDPAVDPVYDPSTKSGWNGPYLVSNGQIPASSDPEFATLQAGGYVQTVPTGAHYYLPGEPALLDPLGRPYVLDPAYDPSALPAVTIPTRVLWGGPDGDLSTVRVDVGDPKFSDFLALTQQ